MNHTLLPDGDTFTDEVDVDFDVLRPTMMDRVAGHVDYRDVATECHRCIVDVAVEFAQKLAQPGALGGRIGDITIFNLGAGPGHRRLALAGP
jgi:hypothetical protein